MKKFITVVSIMLIALSVNSQNKKAKGAKNNDCYLETAAATFSLSEENKVKLNDFLTEKLKEQASVGKKMKASEISKEEGKTQMRTINQTYFKNFSDLTGKSKKDIMNFEKDAKAKCK